MQSGFIWFKIGSRGESSEHNESSGSIKGSEFLD